MEKILRVHELVYGVIDTYEVSDAEKRKAYKYEFILPFLDYLQNELDNRLDNISENKNSQMLPMFNYKKKLNILRERYETIGADAVLDKDYFKSNLEEMCLDWYEHRSWYEKSAYTLRKDYYSRINREKEPVLKFNKSFSEIDGLKDLITKNPTKITWE